MAQSGGFGNEDRSEVWISVYDWIIVTSKMISLPLENVQLYIHN